jgi:hypothetical protein
MPCISLHHLFLSGLFAPASFRFVHAEPFLNPTLQHNFGAPEPLGSSSPHLDDDHGLALELPSLIEVERVAEL